ncbi:MAG: ATP-binding protein, partial [Bdellovibrionota bacterium]
RTFMALLSCLLLWGNLVLADECIQWTMKVILGRPVIDMNTNIYGHPFRANFARLLPWIEKSNKPFTIVMPGLPRTGKTSILRALVDYWAKKNGITLSIDFQDGQPKELMIKLKSSITSMQRNLGDDVVMTRLLNKWLNMVETETDFFVALDRLNLLAKEENKELLLLFDETTVIMGKEWGGEFHKKLFAHNKASKVISYTSESNESLAKLKHDIQIDDATKSAIFFEIKPESPESVRDFLTNITKETEVKFTEDAIDELYKASGGWPFELSLIVHRLPIDVKLIESKHVKTALKDVQYDNRSYKFRSIP